MEAAGRLRDYHERTKHSFESIRADRHFLDWENEPSRFKEYPGLAVEPVPTFEPTGAPTHRVIGGSAGPDSDATLTAEVLSHLLFHAGGVARVMRTAMGEFHFRTHASAGALYPIELYVVAGAVPGLAPGVYHYAPREHGLHRLREGDMRGAVPLAGEPEGKATLVLTAIPWRTAWKYTARGFRHLYWDAGMMLANLLAAGAAWGLSARILLGFVDEGMDQVLGLDGVDEFALCAVALGADRAPAAHRAMPPLDMRVAPVSPRPERDAVIREAREAVRLSDDEAVRSFRSAVARAGLPDEPSVPVEPTPTAQLSTDPLEEVVRRRGSSRALAGGRVSGPEVAALLESALSAFSSDWSAPGPRAFVAANDVDGLPPGAFEYLPGRGFRAVREGRFRRHVAHLCLDQRLGGDAAAAIFLLADLDRYLNILGGRGYAAAQLEASVAAGRLYLSAYAQCLGASGITFYDDEVRAFFETDAEAMIAVVIGREARRRDLTRCRDRREAEAG